MWRCCDLFGYTYMNNDEIKEEIETLKVYIEHTHDNVNRVYRQIKIIADKHNKKIYNIQASIDKVLDWLEQTKRTIITIAVVFFVQNIIDKYGFETVITWVIILAIPILAIYGLFKLYKFLRLKILNKESSI